MTYAQVTQQFIAFVQANQGLILTTIEVGTTFKLFSITPGKEVVPSNAINGGPSQNYLTMTFQPISGTWSGGLVHAHFSVNIENYFTYITMI